MSEDRTIVIDSQEKLVGGIIRKFSDLGYIIVRAAIKPTGDYAFGDITYVLDDKRGTNNAFVNKGIIVERKTVEDFDGSFVNGNPHMSDQSQRLREWMQEDADRHGYLLIIGDETKTNHHANVDIKGRVGMIGSIMASYLLNTTVVKNELSFVLLLHKLFRKYEKDEFGKARKMDFKPTSYGSFGEYVLSGISGVRGTRAEAILEEFDVGIKLVRKHASSPLYIDNIKGIGKKTAKALRKEIDC